MDQLINNKQLEPDLRDEVRSVLLARHIFAHQKTRRRSLMPGDTKKFSKGKSLFFLHYANMLIQYAAIIFSCKNGKFQLKSFDISLTFAQNIEVDLTSTHNVCFRAKIRKRMYNHVNSSFTI